MSQPILLFKKGDLEAGKVRKVDVNGCALAVYNLDGTFYATQDGCSHATASLSEGEIVDDECIACPVHDGTFHIPTGQPMSFPCEHAIRTYKVIEEGEDVLVDLDQESDAAADAI
ncbi:non-heme iron oxygenase ferredoxin subunit [Zoogloea dura]|uniref:Non-heme iron oxygenase ferredoxin subunit n=1 Tax=Zoogloea dura TaxID=2728840 RepID=A0A848G4Z6_9RHOO|nr:non-heme iron oxygenase ferredoxin subunit [Zoogloea dura]NML26036.1 non-heme iron oxygenase ferredoxin subunit [Zoogloea dura]